MREIQAKKERLNLGKERAVKTPLEMTRTMSGILTFKSGTPVGLSFSGHLMRRHWKPSF
jgi:hypothetical protein